MTTTQLSPAVAWDVLLRDGRIAQIRNLVREDGQQLRQLHASLSSRTRLMRFFSVGEQPGVAVASPSDELDTPFRTLRPPLTRRQS